MKVLFVAGANTEGFEMPPLILTQGESLAKSGVEVSYFPIIGKGMFGYLKNIKKIKTYLKSNSIDLIHAHYSFAGLLVSLSNTKIPIVVSLLGSDVNSNRIINKLVLKSLRFFSWDAIIVKSQEMSDKISLINCIIPNGVNTELFQPLDKIDCQINLKWNLEKKHILFAADPNRIEKNFDLTQKAVDKLGNNNIDLHCLKNVKRENVPIWLNAADLIVLSSLWEGSPNVIKESMACNKPIVATDVGDISWLFGEESGHFISKPFPKEFSENIKLGLLYSEYNKTTNGRDRIFKLELDADTVANNIIEIYNLHKR
jgi:glycosyltransferase involved in cell wall biosynthesis